MSAASLYLLLLASQPFLSSARAAAGGPPLPNPRQADFLQQHLTQFFHFSLPTFWDAPLDYLHGPNPTFHNCMTTAIDHSNQTGTYYPCLDPIIFNPTNFSADDWMEHAVALGTDEICLTAHHEGGWALWPTNHSIYSVKLATNWRGGKGDILREFADAANRWGVKICYYLNVADDGFETLVAKATPEQFLATQIGMLTEVLTQYGPVNRFWFDGTQGFPKGTNITHLWQRVYETIRTVSPATLISPYRGDICASTGSLYTSNGPQPNSTDSSSCVKATEDGDTFYPTEMHGITSQMGPDGNTGTLPTYWFWHNWACAGNKTGCPWVGHTNASRIFDSYITTVGHGAILNFNAPADRSGRMNASLAAVMHEAGRALNATFREAPMTGAYNVSIACEGVEGGSFVFDLPGDGGQAFDYVVTREDLLQGQRVANYSFDYQQVGGGGGEWQVLVPPVVKNSTAARGVGGSAGDRPDGNDPRDQYIGRYRIDTPVVNVSTSSGASVKVGKVRFNCWRSLYSPIHLVSIELRVKTVPW